MHKTSTTTLGAEHGRGVRRRRTPRQETIACDRDGSSVGSIALEIDFVYSGQQRDRR